MTHWLFSDPHYSHKNIVRGISEWTDKSGCRDFDTQEQHDNWIVDSINAKAKKDDHITCLGDWSFGGIDKIREFRYRLVCQSVDLILGNHDHNIHKANEQAGWSLFGSVKQYAELDMGKGRQLVLMHYPIQSWINMDRGAIHVHGHVHGNINKMPGRYDVAPEDLWIKSIDEIFAMPRATAKRHNKIEGGNKFGT